MPLSLNRLHELLRLNDDGQLVWRKPTSNRVRAGDVAGQGVGPARCIQIDGVRYMATHLILMMRHGKMPDGFVDSDTGLVFKKQSAGGELTPERLRAGLDYDPESGFFRWKIRTSKRTRIGAIAGNKHPTTGYLRVAIFGRTYLAHRLAWFYVHGAWPDKVDHINGCRTDNRILNLRDVCAQTNSENQRGPTRANKLGVLGVRQRTPGSFAATIGTNGKSKHLGSFRSAEAAHAAYIEAKRRIHVGCTL